MQRFGLLHRARVTVEDETVVGVRVAQTVVDELVGQLGRNQISGVQVALGFQTQLGAVADVLPEKVTGGQVRYLELLGQLHGLRSLARSGRPQQHNSHLRNPS